jgi:hypothetical protein
VTVTEPDRLHTIVKDGPDGPVLSLHGSLSRLTAPGVDSLLTCMRDSGERVAVIDLRNAEVEPDVAELIARRWGIQVAG